MRPAALDVRDGNNGAAGGIKPLDFSCPVTGIGAVDGDELGGGEMLVRVVPVDVSTIGEKGGERGCVLSEDGLQ